MTTTYSKPLLFRLAKKSSRKGQKEDLPFPVEAPSTSTKWPPSPVSPPASKVVTAIEDDADRFSQKQAIALNLIEEMSATRDRYLEALTTVAQHLSLLRSVIGKLEQVERHDSKRTAYEMAKNESGNLVESNVHDVLYTAKLNYAMILRIGSEYERRFEANVRKSSELSAQYQLASGYFGSDEELAWGFRCRSAILKRQFDPQFEKLFFKSFFPHFGRKSSESESVSSLSSFSSSTSSSSPP